MVLDLHCISFIVYHLLSGILVIYLLILLLVLLLLHVLLSLLSYLFFLYLCNITGCHQPHALRFWWHPYL